MNENVTYKIPLINSDKTSVNNPSVYKLIGQKEACRKLEFFTSANSDKTPFPTIIFTGSAGLGKTYMAEKVAQSLGRKFVDVNCGTIETAKDFVEGILINRVSGDQPVTLFLDEAHKLNINSEITTILLSMLNPNPTNKNCIAYGNFMIEYDFTYINTILATTDSYRIFKPLLNRCEPIGFYLYDQEELFKILRKYLPDILITVDKKELAYACRARARDAYVLSQNINRYCIMKDINIFSGKCWEEFKKIFDIYPCGLKKQEVELLKILKEKSPISSTNIALKMGVNVSNVEEEIETRLRELSLIESGQRGRMLTKEGMKYLMSIKE